MTVKAPEENLKVVLGTVPLLMTAGTDNAAAADTKDFDDMLIVLSSGVSVATSTLDVKLQESSDNSSFSDIVGAVFTQILPANDNTVYVGRLKCKNFERYIRAVLVTATANATAGVNYILSSGDGPIPVSQANTLAFALDYVSDGGKASV